MKHQALFSSNDKSKKIKVLSATIFVWRFKKVNIHAHCTEFMDSILEGVLIFLKTGLAHPPFPSQAQYA